MKYKTLIVLIIAVMMPFLRVPPEAFAGTTIFSDSEIAHATAVHAKHLEELMGLPGVHGVGIGEQFGHIGILILVDNENRISHMPKTVEDMPAIIRAVGEITAYQINLGVGGGNNIVCNGYCASGTVGFKVCDNTISDVGGFITNNHVAATGCPGLCPNKASLGTDFFSPSFCDGGITNVGTLNRFIPIVLDNSTLNYVDAAFVQSTDAEVSDNIQWIGPQNNTVVTAYLGQSVCKSGRTSGLTCGTVTGINLTISVSYNNVGQCGIAKFGDQIMYSATSPYTIMNLPGDSGSPVVETNTNSAVALNSAGDQSGDGFGNPIGTVLSALEVSLCSNICIFPNSPNLVSPSNAVTGVSTSPTLDWHDVSGAASYDVQVCSYSNCSSIVSSANVTSSQWTVSPALVRDTQYWWRVRANNSCGSGSWSDIHNFTTCSVPAKPTLSVPLNNATGISLTPTLDWNDVSGASSYMVLVCGNGNCQTAIIRRTRTLRSQWTVPRALTPSTTYYWRVRALNLCGYGPWSDGWKFQTTP